MSKFGTFSRKYSILMSIFQWIMTQEGNLVCKSQYFRKPIYHDLKLPFYSFVIDLDSTIKISSRIVDHVSIYQNIDIEIEYFLNESTKF